MKIEMETILNRENLQTAYKRVKANGGVPGVDGMQVSFVSHRGHHRFAKKGHWYEQYRGKTDQSEHQCECCCC